MKILVVNCGSSSIKYKLYEMDDQSVLAAGGIEKVGLEGSFLKTTIKGEKKILYFDCPTHTEGIKMMFDTLTHPEYGAVKDISEIGAAGHRIVAGGTFTESKLVTPEMLEEWKGFMDLAPLHNPAHLKGYEAVKTLLPELPQVFVFDTSFHQTMPAKAYMYAVPYKYYEENRIRRWGAHGTSHRFVTARVGEVIGVKAEDQKIASCHIGNGASVSAVDHGKCVDTSMGLTPLEGLMMGTRAGDIDTAIVTYLMEQKNMTAEEVLNVLNKKSGVQGLSGVSSDFRDLEKAAKEGNDRAQLALDMFAYQGKKIIGSYAAAMEGVDVIVFTAGIGENTDHMRKAMCEGLEFMGVEFDDEANAGLRGKEAIISKPTSKVTVCVIPTNEELAIAQETEALVR